MAAYTLEFSWLIPVVVHTAIDAADPADALAKAQAMFDADTIPYDHQKTCDDASSTTVVTGLWAGDQSYSGADLRPAAFVADVERIIAREQAPTVASAAAGMLAALEEIERHASILARDAYTSLPEHIAKIARYAIDVATAGAGDPAMKPGGAADKAEGRANG